MSCWHYVDTDGIPRRRPRHHAPPLPARALEAVGSGDHLAVVIAPTCRPSRAQQRRRAALADGARRAARLVLKLGCEVAFG